MKINSLNVLVNQSLFLDKKFYFISGNEKTLMEKIKSIIVEGYKLKENAQIKNIDTISDFVDEVGLFGDKNIYIVYGTNDKSCWTSDVETICLIYLKQILTHKHGHNL